MFKSILNKIIMRYKRIGYSVLAMRQFACLEDNPITVNNFAALFTCKTDRSGLRLYDSPTQSRLFGWLRLDTCLFLSLSGSNWWSSFAPVFQWCCRHSRDLQVSQRVVTVESSLHHKCR